MTGVKLKISWRCGLVWLYEAMFRFSRSMHVQAWIYCESESDKTETLKCDVQMSDTFRCK